MKMIEEIAQSACEVYLSKYDFYDEDLLERVFINLYTQIKPDLDDRVDIWKIASTSLKNKL